ncbi:MAG: ABC transporter substrate-binding protein [Pseudomonadota bacterium]
MKKLFTTVLAAALSGLVATANAGDWKEVRIGVEGAYPPFSAITESGQLVGFDIDIAIALCNEMGVECSLVPQDWDGIIPALLAKKYDAILASMSITEERKKKVAFTGKYYNSKAFFAAPKGANISLTKEGLAGKTVGVQRATTHDNFITAEFGDAVTVKRYGTQDEAYLDAVAGRVDLLLADGIAMDEGFVATEQGAGWELIGEGYSDPAYFGEGAGIAIRKEDTDLVEMFNNAIQAIRANGVYKKINDKYFAIDIY